MKRNSLLGPVLSLLVPGIIHAQEVRLFHRSVQVHGFASQGFIHTSDNNWLTLNSSHTGSGQFTDFGANVSTAVTGKLQVGAQLYDRNLGQLGRWHPSLDWAVVSYRFTPWLGLRGGKIKTRIGLFNDTQDLDFLHPFALLPQSVYPADLRESTVAHTGGDIFGDIRLKGRLGMLSYTGYAGHRHDSQYGGYPYLLQQIPISLTNYGGLQYGADLRWTTPLKGLLVGASRMNEDITGVGTTTFAGPVIPYEEHSNADWANQYYAQYSSAKLEVDFEYRRYWRNQQVFFGAFDVQTDQRGKYIAASYPITKWFQAGSYFSVFTLNEPVNTFPGHSATYGSIKDAVISGRFDITRALCFKVEEHFMQGVGVPSQYPSGFYGQKNPEGLQPNTDALVLKTSFNF